MVFILIDDDPIANLIHRKIIERTCQDIPTEIILFSSAEEALDYMKSLSTADQDFIAFLDINMPKTNGWDFLDRFGNPNPGNNIYILSSSVAQYDISRAKEYPAVKGYFTKPLSIPSVESIVRRSLVE